MKMNRKPRVSGIIIFFNAEQFIQEAIESVLAQTYVDWELLLVDDGSTDASTEIARRYADQYPEKVHYFEHDDHQNRGMSASRNLGVRHARGEYVAFLDADDIWLPHKLEKQVAILDTQPGAAMLYGPTQHWFSWTGKLEDRENDYMTDLGVPPNTLIDPPALLIHLLQDEDSCPSTCSVLIRREVFENIGGFEEDFCDMYEDLILYIKIFLQAPVFVVSTCCDRYRQHENNSGQLAIRTGHWHWDSEVPDPATRAYLYWVEKYLAEKGVENTEVWKVLQRRLRPYRHPLLNRLLRLARMVKRMVLRTLPAPVGTWLKALRLGLAFSPPTGWIRFGSLRRLTPISRYFGADRGQPIDRYYIESFLARHAKDIGGRVLEILDADYTHRFGDDRVTRSDVLDLDEGNPNATIIGDLANAPHIPSDTFDCVIVTQTLQYIYDVRAALRTLHRILKPGGIALVTFPGISNIGDDAWDENWCWAFTTQSARRLFGEIFSPAQVEVEAHGNVLVATAFLHGLAAEELRQTELEHRDPQYEALITVRAVKHEVSL